MAQASPRPAATRPSNQPATLHGAAKGSSWAAKGSSSKATRKDSGRRRAEVEDQLTLPNLREELDTFCDTLCKRVHFLLLEMQPAPVPAFADSIHGQLWEAPWSELGSTDAWDSRGSEDPKAMLTMQSALSKKIISGFSNAKQLVAPRKDKLLVPGEVAGADGKHQKWHKGGVSGKKGKDDHGKKSTKKAKHESNRRNKHVESAPPKDPEPSKNNAATTPRRSSDPGAAAVSTDLGSAKQAIVLALPQENFPSEGDARPATSAPLPRPPPTIVGNITNQDEEAADIPKSMPDMPERQVTTDDAGLDSLKLLNPHTTLGKYHVAARRRAGDDTSRCSCLRMCEHVVYHPWFEVSNAFMVFANNALVGVTMQYVTKENFDKQSSDLIMPIWSIAGDWFFLAWFIIEVSTRICAERWSFVYRYQKMRIWNLCEVIATLAMLAEQVLITIDNSLRLSLVILKVFRGFRVAAMCHKLSKTGSFVEAKYPQMHTMLASLFSSGRFFLYSCIIVFLNIYVFAVFLTSLVLWHARGFGGDNSACTNDACLKDLYGTMATTILTLLQIMTGGRDWAASMKPLTDNISNELGPLYSLWVSFAIFHIMNVITGVFVDSAMKHANKDRAVQMVMKVGNFFELLHSSTTESDRVSKSTADPERCRITYEQFKSHLNDAWLKEYFEFIDVDASEAKKVFQLMDVNENGYLGADEFLNGCVRLSGSARSVELAILMYDNKRFHKKVSSHIRMVERRFNTLLDLMSAQLPSASTSLTGT